jgi:hypothetical protein
MQEDMQRQRSMWVGDRVWPPRLGVGKFLLWVGRETHRLGLDTLEDMLESKNKYLMLI